MTTTPATTATAPVTANRPGSPAHRSPGASARCPAGATSSPPSRVLGGDARRRPRRHGARARTGFLPADPEQMAGVLAAHQLTAVGGFTPVVMHRPDHDPLPEIDRILDAVTIATGAEVLVLSATSGLDGYDTRPTLDDDGWAPAAPQPRPDHRPRRRARRRAPCCTRTSGTMVETGDEVQRVLERLVDLAVPGHRAPADRRHRPGRADPAGPRPDRAHPPQGRRQHRRRRRSAPGGSTYTDGCRRGHVPAAGHGRRRRRQPSSSTLQGNGYAGWYTLEQDTILTEEPRGEGPVDRRPDQRRLRPQPADRHVRPTRRWPVTRHRPPSPQPHRRGEPRGTTTHRSAGRGTHQRAVHRRPARRRPNADSSRSLQDETGPRPSPGPTASSGSMRRTPT